MATDVRDGIELKLDDGEFRTLMRKLSAFPVKYQRTAVRRALSAGAGPILKAARKLIPKGTGLKPDGGQRKHLKRTLTKKAKTYRHSGVTVVVIGPRAGEGFHAHMVHGGTQPHPILASGKKLLADGTRVFGRKVRHPGAAANPFLDKALTSQRSAALAIIKSKLASELARIATLV